MAPRNKFHCLRAAIDGGFIANMSRLDRGVYQSIYHHADGNTCLCSAGAGRIAYDAGERNVGRVRTALKQLEQLGLLEVVREGGGRNNPTLRRLLEPAPLPHWIPYGQACSTGQTEPHAGPESGRGHRRETGTPRVPLFDGCDDGLNPDESGAQRGTVSGAKGGQFRAQRGTPHVPRSQVITNYHQHHGGIPPLGGGGGDNLKNLPAPPDDTPVPQGDPEAVRFLVEKCGTWQELAEECARAMTAAECRELWSRVVNSKGVKDRARAMAGHLRKALKRKFTGVAGDSKQ